MTKETRREIRKIIELASTSRSTSCHYSSCQSTLCAQIRDAAENALRQEILEMFDLLDADVEPPADGFSTLDDEVREVLGKLAGLRMRMSVHERRDGIEAVPVVADQVREWRAFVFDAENALLRGLLKGVSR